MPIHDWMQVSAGDFHDFHQVWTGQIRIALNEGILPPGYYAQIEQRASGVTPDVLTLQYSDWQLAEDDPAAIEGTLAVAVAPPKVSVHAELERRLYAEMKNRVVIHHSSDNRIVSIVEIVSSGNKASEREFQKFLAKAVSAIEQGIHLLFVDLYPPTSRDPNGIHGAIWSELGEGSYVAPAQKPLTLCSYVAGDVQRAYVEPVAVGESLVNMPLFLTINRYVNVPLEPTYQAAFRGIAPHVERELAKPA